MKTDVFTIRDGEWRVRIGDKILSAVWNSKGAALAGLQVELRRLENRKPQTQGVSS
jgi:hypothetical protein